MKKIIAFIVCVLAVQAVMAQDIRIGLRAGLNLSNQQIETEGLDLLNTEFNAESRLGWQAGLVVDAPFFSLFHIQPALMLSTKGYKFEETYSFGRVEMEARPLYLDLHIPVLLRLELGELRVFAGAGPYLGYGVAGEIESTGNITFFNFADEGEIAWGSGEENSYKPFDWGGILTAGLEFNRIQLALAYEHGLANIHSQASEDNSTHNRTLSLTTAFFLKK